MHFYSVAEAYLALLKAVDSRTPDGYKGAKPFLGPVLNINGLDWFAPLTSEKDKFAERSPDAVQFFPLQKPGDPTSRLGAIDFRFMIPVPVPCRSLFPFTSRGPAYKAMLDNQMIFIKSKQDDIRLKAQVFHAMIVGRRSISLNEQSCDFAKVEACCVKHIARELAAAGTAASSAK